MLGADRVPPRLAVSRNAMKFMVIVQTSQIGHIGQEQLQRSAVFVGVRGRGAQTVWVRHRSPAGPRCTRGCAEPSGVGVALGPRSESINWMRVLRQFRRTMSVQEALNPIERSHRGFKIEQSERSHIVRCRDAEDRQSLQHCPPFRPSNNGG